MDNNAFDLDKQNSKIVNSISSSIKSIFPIKGKYRTLVLKDFDLDASKVLRGDIPLQKELKLQGKSLEVPLYADLDVVDNETGQVLNSSKLKIANIPKLTSRFSTIIKGNEYQTVNQFRLKSGVYTREKQNGEFESQFNLEKGFNFKLIFNPETQIFFLVLGNQNYHLYTLLRAIGVSDDEMKKFWGNEIFSKNQQVGINLEEREIVRLYKKVRHKDLPFTAALEGLKKYFDETRISTDTTLLTLGESFERVTPALFLRTSKKLLNVHRGKEPADERDSLIFKDLYSVDDLLQAHFDARKEAISKSLKYRLDNKMSPREIISSDTFNKPILEFFYQGELSSTPTQTNPIDIVTEWKKTTIKGVGGVTEEHAITDKMRDVHPSHFGFLDSVSTTEGSPGITLNLSMGVQKDPQQKLRTPFRMKDGTRKFLSPLEIYNMHIGFPDQYKFEGGRVIPNSKTVKGMHRGQADEFPASEIEAYLERPSNMFTWSSNLIPFLNYNSGARAMYGSKQMSQAVPLIHNEQPLVQVKIPKVDKQGFKDVESFEDLIGSYLNPRATKAGTVSKVTKDYIYLDVPGEKERTRVGLYNMFPLNQESYIHSTPIVQVGDKVEADQILATNNFQNGGSLALGTNLLTAYMPWQGQTYEDSVVISESASKKLTSVHIFKEELKLSKLGVNSVDKYNAYFPGKLNSEKIAKLDDEGVIKEGARVDHGDYLAVYMEPRDLTDEERVLRSIKKVLSQPYIDRSLVWEHDSSGEVLYVRRIGNTIQVTVKTEDPAVIGDKLSARSGAKGIISKVVPDTEMPHTADGRVVDYILSPLSYPGRTNTGQILETAAGKLALKRGKPYLVENFDNTNYLDKIKDELASEGLSDTETLYDGKDGKPFENPILVGPQQIFKLRHVIEHKFNARAHGKGYTTDEQPTSGTGGGGASLDTLQNYALLSAGAKSNIYDALAIKGQKNDEYWRNVSLGLPTPPPNQNFVWDKFKAYMQGVGVDVVKEGNNVKLVPLTDKKVLEMSAGELENAGYMLRGKNLAAIRGGLFDDSITGGVNGKKFAHIVLNTKLPNPMYEVAIKSLLELTRPEYENILAGKSKINGKTGAEGILSALEKFDVNKEFDRAKFELTHTKNATKINALNKKVRYLDALKLNNLTPLEAYSMKYVPVLPPVFRPIVPLPSGDLHVAPINEHYRDIAVLNNSLKTEEALGDSDRINVITHELYKTVSAAQGHIDPMTYKKNKYEGILRTLAGGSSPKSGFIQDKMWRKRQDLSGRSTITLEPDLGLDEVGLPLEMAKKIYKPYIVRNLVQFGIKPTDALKNYQDWTPLAQRSLEKVIDERPVLLNRAPSLHKWSTQAFRPVLHAGKDIKMNPIVSGTGHDFDGDKQHNQVIVMVLDNDLEIAYISKGNNTKYNKQFWETRKISSRKNVTLPMIKNGNYYIINLEDFPYKENKLLGKKDHIEFYEAEDYINAVVYDEKTGELKTAPISGWSIHKDREVWTVTLTNKSQIITDDDPRAVYGLNTDTWSMKRYTPSESIGVPIPIAKNLITSFEPSLYELQGLGKLKQTIKLNKNVGYVIGTICGDGWVDIIKNRTCRVNLAGIEHEVLNQYKDFVQTEFFKDVVTFTHRVNKTSYGKSEKTILSSVDFAELILPLIGKGAKNKHLPPFWHKTTRDFRIGLLSGLLDTDGTVAQTHGKSKPQLQSNISSISLRLLQEIQHLLLSLNIYSKISFCKKTQVGNDFWILTISGVDLFKIKDELNIAHVKNKEAFNIDPPNDEGGSYLSMDKIPFNKNLLEILQPGLLKYSKALYATTIKSKNNHTYITRHLAKRLIKFAEETNKELPEKWLQLVKNTSVKWEFVTEVENTGKKETGYDLTVPGYETFMSVDGIILSNTMSVYTPVSQKSVEEAWAMLPSRNMFHHSKDPYGANPIHSLSREYLLGLYHMTREGDQTNKVFRTLNQARNAEERGEINVRDYITIGTKKTSLGRELLNDVLPGNIEITKTVDSKYLKEILTNVAKNYPNDLVRVINSFKDYGKNFGHKFSTSLSLSDFYIPENGATKIYEKYKAQVTPAMTKKERGALWVKMTDEMYAKNADALRSLKRPNNFKYILDSGAISGKKAINVHQITSQIGAVKDINNNPLPVPITGNWGKGLNSWEYYQSMYGSRKGVVDKAINTQDSGELNKSLLNNTKSVLITIEDCGTKDYIELDNNDKNLLGRLLAKDVMGIGKRNTVIDPALFTRIQSKSQKIPVRSPLTCEADRGVCQMCYGIMPDGKFPPLGYNVGVADSQSVSERATQLTLSSFHSGSSAASASKGVEASFEDLDEIFKLPDVLPGKAILSVETGKVTKIRKHPAGGYGVMIAGKEHYVPANLDLLVHEGSVVKKGQRLSSGKIKPQELSKLRNLHEARLDMVNRIKNIYGDEFHNRAYETAVRGITDLAKVTEVPDDVNNIYKGDYAYVSTLNHLNKARKLENKNLIKYEPHFSSVATQHVNRDDFLAQMSGQKIKSNLIEASARMRSSNIHGRDPLPGMLYGLEFGQQFDPKKEIYY